MTDKVLAMVMRELGCCTAQDMEEMADELLNKAAGRRIDEAAEAIRRCREVVAVLREVEETLRSGLPGGIARWSGQLNELTETVHRAHITIDVELRNVEKLRARLPAED